MLLNVKAGTKMDDPLTKHVPFGPKLYPMTQLAQEVRLVQFAQFNGHCVQPTLVKYPSKH